MNRAKKTAKQSDRDSAAAYEKLLKVTKVISYKERLKKLKGVVLSWHDALLSFLSFFFAMCFGPGCLPVENFEAR